jgi:hypothetical protein
MTSVGYYCESVGRAYKKPYYGHWERIFIADIFKHVMTVGIFIVEFE